MRSGLPAKATWRTLLFLFLLAPNLLSMVNAQPNYPIAVSNSPTAPSLPLPIVGFATPIVPVTGVIRVLVIAAAYPDVNSTMTIAQLKRAWFGAVGTYYHEISYGKLTIQGDMYGWYKLPYPKAHYGKNCLAINDADCSGSDQSYQIANDAVALAPKDLNLNNYDYYVFIHSGPGQETSGAKDDVWSVTYMSGIWIRTNSKTLTKFNIIPELEAFGSVPNGVWCLEFGHNLGLPDLYNVGNGKSLLGPWELMDKGSFNGNPPGSSPAHMTVWGKIKLGFINGPMLAITRPGATSTFTVDPTEVASTNVHAIKIHLTSALDPSQYYLVEVRTKKGFDSALPAEGVLITYVDETFTIGPVKVMDHPKLSLDYAVWDVGQVFTNSEHNLAVKVTSKVGNSYRITVTSNNPQTSPPISNETSMTPQSLKMMILSAAEEKIRDAYVTLPNFRIKI